MRPSFPSPLATVFFPLSAVVWRGPILATIGLRNNQSVIVKVMSGIDVIPVNIARGSSQVVVYMCNTVVTLYRLTPKKFEN